MDRASSSQGINSFGVSDDDLLDDSNRTTTTVPPPQGINSIPGYSGDHDMHPAAMHHPEGILQTPSETTILNNNMIEQPPLPDSSDKNLTLQELFTAEQLEHGNGLHNSYCSCSSCLDKLARQMQQFENRESIIGRTEVSTIPEWTFQEDDILRAYIESHGVGNWKDIPGLYCRDPWSCYDRWLNHLMPKMKKVNLTIEEQDRVIELHSKMGNEWAQIAAELPGRTVYDIQKYVLQNRKHSGGSQTKPSDMPFQKIKDNSEILPYNPKDDSNCGTDPASHSETTLPNPKGKKRHHSDVNDYTRIYKDAMDKPLLKVGQNIAVVEQVEGYEHDTNKASLNSIHPSDFHASLNCNAPSAILSSTTEKLQLTSSFTHLESKDTFTEETDP